MFLIEHGQLYYLDGRIDLLVQIVYRCHFIHSYACGSMGSLLFLPTEPRPSFYSNNTFSISIAIIGSFNLKMWSLSEL